jgi:hypothetical protein
VEDQKTESSAIESFPKIARIKSLPAAFLRSGSAASMKFRQAALSCCFASLSARTPRSAKTTRARLMVKCRSLATRRTSAARSAGIVTLCRTDLDATALLFADIVSEYQGCTRVVRASSALTVNFGPCEAECLPLAFRTEMRPALSHQNSLDLRAAVDARLSGPPVNAMRQLKTPLPPLRIHVIRN